MFDLFTATFYVSQYLLPAALPLSASLGINLNLSALDEQHQLPPTADDGGSLVPAEAPAVEVAEDILQKRQLLLRHAVLHTRNFFEPFTSSFVLQA